MTESANMMQPPSLSDLVQRAEQLAESVGSGEELPRINRNVGQILEAGNKLWNRMKTDQSEVKASLLLASKGVDISGLNKTLEDVCQHISLETTTDFIPTDVDSFVKSELENAMMEIVTRTRQQTRSEADAKFWRKVDDDWEAEKMKIIDSLSVAPVSNYTRQPGEGQYQASFNNTMNVSLNLRGYKEHLDIEYSNAVQGYVRGTQSASQFASLLEGAAETCKSTFGQQLIQLTDELNKTGVRESSSEETRSKATECTLLATVISSLEQRAQDAAFTVERYGPSAARDLNLVKQHLKTIPLPATGLQKTGDGTPIWPVALYALRFGLKEKLVSWLAQVGESTAAMLLSGRVGKASSLKEQYASSLGHSLDTYKNIVFGILLGQHVDSQVLSAVVTDSTDLIWLRLTQCVNSTTLAQATQQKAEYPLSRLQADVREEDFFRHLKLPNPGTDRFFALYYTLQFEAALEHLFGTAGYQAHAIHTALLLHEGGLLLTPAHTGTMPLSVPSGGASTYPRLNLARLVLSYCQSIEQENPTVAAHYYALLNNLKTPDGDSVYLAGLAELLQRHPDKADPLLGFVDENGKRRPGIVDSFFVNATQLLQHLGQRLREQGNLRLAITCFDQLGSHGEVASLCSNLLSEHATRRDAEDHERASVYNACTRLARRFRAFNVVPPEEIARTFYVLLDLYPFFDNFHSENYQAALSIIHEIGLLPRVSAEVHSKKQAIEFYTDDLLRILPDILLTTMRCLASEYRQLRLQNISRGNYESPSFVGSLMGSFLRSPNNTMEALSPTGRIKVEAQCLVEFVGVLPHQFPPSLYSDLSSAQLMLG